MDQDIDQDRAEHNDQGATIGAPDGAAPATSSESETIEKDISESPGSERETEAKQNEDPAASRTEVSGSAEVNAVPGTGGPDDVGDVEVDPDEVSLNGKPFPGHAGTT
ncbi:hypothetical protein [Rathayibacter tanaceti]|uniref:Uncharacterized protein n=2 Tax=Rathayibacter tanaceti TaxID=1671680 RepID=A0A162GIA5_9MICO|nr:hypothetical protein [Rathayibacter tanaceti]KZX21629.1 hypothetical protein ACH61_01231 [Rathayibacter tanaceti]QHC56490.1 hypothetical protein GSU10_13200 [Rathayibacter tanaceti]TCO36698.1 hypothetical protein EV639_106101 [Rathayibacter tanaceti]